MLFDSSCVAVHTLKSVLYVKSNRLQKNIVKSVKQHQMEIFKNPAIILHAGGVYES